MQLFIIRFAIIIVTIIIVLRFYRSMLTMHLWCLGHVSHVFHRCTM